MEHSIEYDEVRIAFPKAIHILYKTILCSLGISCPNGCIILAADLDYIFIEAVALIRRGNYIRGRRTTELVFKVSGINAPVLSFLPAVVLLNSLVEYLVIHLIYEFVHKSDVITDPCLIHIFRNKCAIVMRKAALALAVG